MIPYIRRKKLLEYLEKSEVAYLHDLANETGASEATIRRDLKSLEKEGRINILQGGAAMLVVNEKEKSAIERMDYKKTEKSKLGAYAATLISKGDFIFLGAGTTENWIIDHIRNKDVTVVTNGVVHLSKLAEFNIDTILIGGKVRSDFGVISCDSAIEQIKRMNFDKCFLGGLGISEERGVSTSGAALAQINKMVIESSKESYLLVDSTKYNKVARYSFSQLEDFTNVICIGEVYSSLDSRNNVIRIEADL
ncbi:DeoR/GlpR family DNA-binding transcription regulator [Mycoplasmatota bacterium zrk1]